MAISPAASFPGKTAPASPAYPLGSAQDISAAGAGDGTPWRAELVNDLFGFQQALLDAASVVASGSPDEVGASQYLQALQALFAPIASSAPVQIWTGSSTSVTDADILASSGFTVAPGRYWLRGTVDTLTTDYVLEVRDVTAGVRTPGVASYAKGLIDPGEFTYANRVGNPATFQLVKFISGSISGNETIDEIWYTEL